MSNTDYLTATMSVDKTPEEVFAAVVNVRGWWSENIIGNTAAVGDEFIFNDDSEYAGETSRTKTGIRFCRFQLTEVVPGRRVVWHVVDSDLNFIDDRDEWTDTNVVFEISSTSNTTTLRLTHEGLTDAESECFGACSKGWTFYVTTSLPQLINTGSGQPIPKYSV